MIQLEGITKSFGALQVLKGIDLEIGKGEVVSIVGPSGAGKTTLLQIMGTLDKPDGGRIILNGTEVNRLKEKELSAFRNREIGFVFQFHQLLPEFTAVENVMMPSLIQASRRELPERKHWIYWIFWDCRSGPHISRQNFGWRKAACGCSPCLDESSFGNLGGRAFRKSGYAEQGRIASVVL